MAKATLNTIEKELSELLLALEGTFPFALVGGLAVSVRTHPRFTHDLDFAVSVESDATATAVIHHLIQRRFTIAATLENHRHGRLGTVRLRRTPESPLIDLLFAAAGIEPEVVAAAEPMTVLGHRIKVAKIGHLIAFKLLARDDKQRPQDLVDLHALSAAADEDEWALEAEAIQLIEARGYARKRDLKAALAEWRDQSVR